MRNVVFTLVLAAFSIIYFRSRREFSNKVVTEWDYEEQVDRSLSYRNCTLPTCLDLQRCMRNYTHLTVYIQPLVMLKDSRGIVISPPPSREFLEIREALSEFATPNAAQACLVLPGVDFLNENRFSSGSEFRSATTIVKHRMKQTMLFNFIGTGTLDSITVRAVPELTFYRPLFDVSVPLLVPSLRLRAKGDTVRSIETLVPLVNVSAQLRHQTEKELQGLEGVYFVHECATNSSMLCTSDDQKLSSTVDDLMRASRVVVLLDDSPLFARLLTVSLSAGTVPVVFSPNHVLPLRDLIDYSSIVFQLSSVGRISSIVARPMDESLRQMSQRGMVIYEEYFSSPSAIARAAHRVLESRILPTRSQIHRSNDVAQCDRLLPHLSQSTRALAVVVVSWPSSIAIVNSICSAPVLEKTIVFWTSDSEPPEVSTLDCASPVDVVAGVMTWRQVVGVVASETLESQAVFVILEGTPCPITSEIVSTAFTIWRSNPHAAVHLPATDICDPVVVVHKAYMGRDRKPFVDDEFKLVLNSTGIAQIQLVRATDNHLGPLNGSSLISRVLI